MNARSNTREFETLSDLLAAVRERNSGAGRLSVAELQDLAGPRAFGPLLLLPGMIAVTPLSGIPTLPTMLGILVMLISGQIVLGRRELWLPRRLSRAGIDRAHVRKALDYAERPAGFIDRVVRRRLVFATEGLGLRLGAAVCFLTAATMPPLEILPFLATSAGSVITVFGLAITVHDGVLMLAAVALLAALAVAGYFFFV